ncbi:MAG: sodium:solute symporter [Bacteroidota bacterium]
MNEVATSEQVWATAALLGVYVVFVLFFVVRGAMKTKSIKDYALGNISFSPVAVGLALAASMTSAATFIINPGFIALYGISGVLSMAIVLPIAAFVSLVVLTKGFQKIGSSVQALTMAQWIGKRYDSKGFALFFAFLSLLLVTFIVLICVGLTQVLASSLNADPLYVLIGVVVFIFGYMMFGGANSMVYTNTIQASLMLVVAFILLGSGYNHFSEGVHGFLDKLESIDPNLASVTNPSSFLFRDFFEIIFCQLIIGVAIVCQPHIITKSLLLKNEKAVNTYLTVGILVEAVFFFVVFTGLYARITFPDLTLGGEAIKLDSIMSTYVVREFPVYLALLVILGLISAGVSTLEGLIQSVSTTISEDIIKPLFGHKLYASGNTDKKQILVNKLVIGLLAVISILLSYNQILYPNLSVGIFAQNGVYAYFAAAFIPVIFGMFLKNVPPVAVIGASVLALVTHFAIYYGGITHYMQGTVRNPGIAAALAILISAFAGTVIYLFQREKYKIKQLGRAETGS